MQIFLLLLQLKKLKNMSKIYEEVKKLRFRLIKRIWTINIKNNQF